MEKYENFTKLLNLLEGKKYYDTDPLFENNFGLIINDKIFLSSFYRKGGISIDKIKSISVLKKRKNYFNIFSFSITFILLVFLVLLNYNFLIKIITFCTALIFIIIAFKIKKYEYTVLLIFRNLDFKETRINKEMKEHAKELVFYINKIIRAKTKIN